MAEPVVVVSRPGSGALDAPFDPPNPVYDLVEAALRGLGLDAARAGTPDWNPLGDLVAPGDRVLVKPSFGATHGATHGVIVRPIVDYALRAVGRRGRVTVADTPDAGCDLDASGDGIRALLAAYAARGQHVDFIDLRQFALVPRLFLDGARVLGRALDVGLLWRRRLPGDPLGYRVVDIGERSYFAEVAERAPRFCGDRRHRAAPRPHHARGRHRYSIARTVLDADVVITIPRLHANADLGLASALASSIGLTNERSSLPHYTAGAPPDGGDEFPYPPSLLARLNHRLHHLPLPLGNALIRRVTKHSNDHGSVTEGAWEGNDTLWRALLDLNQVLFYADRNGDMTDRPQRRHLALVDALDAGFAIAGRDPALVDVAAARALGWDEAKLPTIAHALAAAGRPLLPTSDAAALRIVLDGALPAAAFAPPPGWPSLAGGSTISII